MLVTNVVLLSRANVRGKTNCERGGGLGIRGSRRKNGFPLQKYKESLTHKKTLKNKKIPRIDPVIQLGALEGGQPPTTFPATIIRKAGNLLYTKMM